MSVDTIGIRELRNGLSRHLAEVRDGGEIIVTDHGTPIARIVPIGEESGLEKLVREGIAKRPTVPRQKFYPEPVKANGSVLEILEDSRGRY